MAAPTFVGIGTHGTVTANGDDEVYPTNPASLAVDDILVCPVVSGDDNEVITFPTGWTKEDESPHGDPVAGKGAWAWRRVTNVSESDDSITITQTNNTKQLYAVIFALRGCETSGNPFNQFIRWIGDGVTSADIAAITTTGIDKLLVSLVVVEDNKDPKDDGAYYALKYMVESAAGSDAAIGIYERAAATAGTYALDTVTIATTSENVVTWVIDFKPPSGGVDLSVNINESPKASETLDPNLTIGISVAECTDVETNLL